MEISTFKQCMYIKLSKLLYMNSKRYNVSLIWYKGFNIINKINKNNFIFMINLEKD